jgi:hypothetical protein
MAINFNAPSQVRPYANLGAFPATGAVKTIYIAEDTNYIYRWNGTAYIEISVADLVGYVPYSGATQDVNLGAYDAYVNKLWLYDSVNDNYGSLHLTDTDFHIEDADGHKMLVIEDGFMQIHKTDTVQSNLFTSGLTATRDHYLPDASGTIALTSNLAGYVPTTRTLTINGTTQDLSADRTFTISTGITIGTTAITSGTVGRVLFEGTGNVVSESANLFWDNTNGRLGIGGTPTTDLHIQKSGICIIKIQSTGNASRLDFSGSAYNNIQSNNDVPFYFDFYNTLNFRGNGGSVQALRIVGSTGNVLINTTTDAGYKLDVNGTARVSGNTTITSADVANPDVGPSAFNVFNGTFSKFNVVYNTAGVRVNMFGTSTQGLRIDAGSNNNITVQGGGGLTLSCASNNFSINSASILLNVAGSERARFAPSTGNFLIGTTTDIASSKLTIESTTQGFLPPRMTTTQKNAIASPATGLMVYDTTLNLMALYNGTTWTTL